MTKEKAYEVLKEFVSFIQDNLANPEGVENSTEQGHIEHHVSHTEMLEAFSKHKEKQSIAVYKNPYLLKLGFEYKDEDGRKIRYVMSICALKDMQDEVDIYQKQNKGKSCE
jgi:regulator of RNase E activity RraB